MKTLIINGSPRKNGDTASLLNIFASNLSGEIKFVNTYYDNIQPCDDCRFCHTHDMCRINDNMLQIYTDILNADNIVIASPLYFSELSGSLLNFASRLQYFYISKAIRKKDVILKKNKKGILILTGGNGNPATASKTANILFSQMGAVLHESIYSMHTDSICAAKDKNATEKCEKIATILSR